MRGKGFSKGPARSDPVNLPANSDRFSSQSRIAPSRKTPCNPPRELQKNKEIQSMNSLDNWDPITDDFKTSQDSMRNRKETYSVYLSQLPRTLSEDGLRSLFADRLPCSTPTRISIQTGRDRDYNIAFIDYPNMVMCEEAIRVMDGYSEIGPLPIRVKLSNSTQEKRGSGRMMGGPNRGPPARGGNIPPSRTRDETSSVPFDQVRSPPPRLPNSSQPRVHSSPTRQTPPSPRPSQPDPPKTGPCLFCGLFASNSCRDCPGVYYCNATCQFAGWPVHQLVCKGANANNSANDETIVKNAVKAATMESLPKVELPPRESRCLWVDGQSPLEFCVQLTENEALIANITETVHCKYEGEPVDPSYHPKGGDVVAALFENEWFRAEVQTVNSAGYRVRYIDYGNCGNVTRGDVRKLTHLLNVMPQAIKCRLHDIAVPDEHSVKVREYFAQELHECKQDLRVKKVREERGVTYVNLLHINGQSFQSMLVKEGHAYLISQPQPLKYSSLDNEIEMGSSHRVNLTHVNDLDDKLNCVFQRKEQGKFVVELEDERGQNVLDLMSRKLQGASPGPVIYRPQCHQLVPGKLYETTITNLTSPTNMCANFYDEHYEDAQKFLTKIKTAGEGKATFRQLRRKPSRNELVLCFNVEEEEWYRGYVKEDGIKESSCSVYSLDYGSTDELQYDMIVPAGDDMYNSFPPFAFRVKFQEREKKILAQMRDNFSHKQHWLPILQSLLMKENFEATVVRQDSLEVTIQPVFDFHSALKEKIKSLVERKKVGGMAMSAASTTSRSSDTPPPLANNGMPALVNNTATSSDVEYKRISRTEWEHLMGRLSRMERALRELGKEV